MLTAEIILEAWERGRGRTAARRALLLLELAGVGHAGSVSMAARNALLLRLRSDSFGDALQALATCPSCAASLEFEASARELAMLLERQLHSTSDSAGGPGESSCCARRSRMRPLSTLDLAEISEIGGSEAIAREILRRSLADSTPQQVAAPLTDLDPTVARALEVEVTEGLSESEIVVALTCAECRHSWTPVLDVPALVWEELEAAARSLLDDIHLLACGYGWSERDILALSPGRREAYVALLVGATS